MSSRSVRVGVMLGFLVCVFASTQSHAGVWGQEKELWASDGQSGDYFGNRLELDSTTLLVGSPLADAAYIYEKDAGGTDNWGEVVKLTASDGEDGDWFGVDVSIDGDTAVAGAFFGSGTGAGDGAAYIFHRNEGGTDNWGEVKKLTRSGTGSLNDYFGIRVTNAGDLVAIGAQGVDDFGTDVGAVYLFSRDEGGADNWGEIAVLSSSDGTTEFGKNISLDGDTLVVGAKSKAYVFQKDFGGTDNWGEVAILSGPEAFYGSYVAIEADTVMVGAEQRDGSGPGAVYVYDRNLGGTDAWGELKKFNDPLNRWFLV